MRWETTVKRDNVIGHKVPEYVESRSINAEIQQPSEF